MGRRTQHRLKGRSRQTDRQAGTCGARTVRQLLAPLSSPRPCPFQHLSSTLSQREGPKAGPGMPSQPSLRPSLSV